MILCSVDILRAPNRTERISLKRLFRSGGVVFGSGAEAERGGYKFSRFGALLYNAFFPDLITTIGFIFSFIITFQLLLFYRLVCWLFPDKPKWIMGPVQPSGDRRNSFFPIELVLFGSYPLLAPLYNLFVTPLISFTLFLAPLTLIPYICDLVYIPMNIALWTFEVPSSADIFLRYDLTKTIVTLYFTVLFCGGIYITQKKLSKDFDLL